MESKGEIVIKKFPTLKKVSVPTSFIQTHAATSQIIANMILFEKIEIFELPLEVRLDTPRYYIMAFRVYRDRSAEKYRAALELLKSDIELLKGGKKRDYIRTYDDAIWGIKYINKE